METKAQECYAANFGLDDCENPATTSVRIDGELTPACASCAKDIDDMRAIEWNYWAAHR